MNRVCTLCNVEFDCVDLVHTFLGTSWALTCAPCNRASRLDIETEKRIAEIWWRAQWAEAIVWEEAVIAYREWAGEQQNLTAAILSVRHNTLVRLLSRVLRRDECLITRELMDRCMSDPSLTPKVRRKTSIKWPARSDVS